MDRCECYQWGERFECRYSEDGRPYGIMVGYNYCSGTKECEACSCVGDKTKCDFYPDIKRKAIYELKRIKTNADRIRHMTDEELAEHFSDLIKDTREYEYCEEISDWLEWLQTEVID